MEFTRAAAGSAALHAFALTVAAVWTHSPATRIDFAQGQAAIRLENATATQAIELLAAPDASETPTPVELAAIPPRAPSPIPPERPLVEPRPSPATSPVRRRFHDAVPHVERPPLGPTPDVPPAERRPPQRPETARSPAADSLPVALARAESEPPCEPPEAATIESAKRPTLDARTTPIARRERDEPAPIELATVAPRPTPEFDAPPVDRALEEARPDRPTEAKVEVVVRPLARADVGDDRVTASSIASIVVPLVVEGSDRPLRGLPTNRPPEYPRDAWLNRVQGVVTLRLVIRPDGAVREASVSQSSGSRALDEAALAAARRWRYEPRPGATEDAVDLLPMRFVIRGADR